jgi:hypothetical protein
LCLGTDVRTLLKKRLWFSPRERRLTLAWPFQRREAAPELFPSRSDG